MLIVNIDYVYYCTMYILFVIININIALLICVHGFAIKIKLWGKYTCHININVCLSKKKILTFKNSSINTYVYSTMLKIKRDVHWFWNLHSHEIGWQINYFCLHIKEDILFQWQKIYKNCLKIYGHK